LIIDGNRSSVIRYNIGILMASKPNKNKESISKGLLNDKQKYRNGQPEAIEMREM